MAHGRHSRRRRRRSQARRASSGDLLEQVRQSLARGDGRGALDRLRRVRHEDGDPEALPLLFFCACVQRARQLTENGLDEEAAVMRERAARHRVSVSPRTLEGDDLVRYLRCLEGAEALAVYVDYLNARLPVPRAERWLADRLVVRRSWEGLEALEADHPLRRDASPVVRSLDAMDAGDWERAAELLQGIPRRSPFAAWRLFCKAMVCFGAGDDRGLRRALDLLPADFVLTHTVAEWRRICTGEGEGGAIQVQRALGTDGATLAALGDALRHALGRKGRTRDIEGLLAGLADALYPEEPLHARMDLLQIAGLATLRDKLQMKTVHTLAQRLLPADRVAGTVARINLMVQRVSPDLWDPAPAAVYLGRLPVEFPEASDQALARGRVLEALARSGHKAIDPRYLPPRMMGALAALLGGPIDDPEMLFVELTMASLEADPGNREGYRFLLDLLRGHAADKPRLHGILQEMATRFPNDPDPWLELATLHYSRNAYRRAEHALVEARQRAPHDERILDLQAIGFLKSADQSRKSGRFALAARDLRRAGDLGRPLLGTVLPVKRLLLEVVSRGEEDAAEVAAPHLEPLPAGARLRTLALLLKDLEGNRHIKNVRSGMGRALRELLARETALIDVLAPDEVVALLAPLPADFRLVYDDLRVVPVLADWWAALMARLEGDRLVAVFDMLMDCGRRAPVRAEIDRRLRGLEKARRDPLLLFYLAVIRYHEGHDHDARRFAEVIRGAESSDRERLRAAAARLARHTQGRLRQALQEFDFDSLDVPSPLCGPEGLSIEDLLPLFGDGEPSIEAVLDELARSMKAGGKEERLREGFAEALGEALGGGEAERWPDAQSDGPSQGSLFGDAHIAGEVRRLEALIDEHRLRGAPESVIEEIAGAARDEPESRRALDRIARECEATGLRGGLSREMHTLLFPGQRRRR